ncbi:NAD(P)-binding protein [Penicillium odoratum]|uniref:NAD(P)-binding protein n=1 Tax=Penicillium odoratum TaxID=1167516 RepID=UPI0025474B2C|nr:NAD(P)-binding protein [Penicillium odoratum]KAJ5758512.1 NAD(P)-binding protein [Penicillium odoratum]
MAALKPECNVQVIIDAGGMGLSIARRLANGYRLLIADFSSTNLSAAVESLRDDGYDLALTAAKIGRIFAVVHTAGVSPASAAGEQIYEVDLLGTANLIDAFFRVASAGTSLICVASMAGNFARLSPGLESHLQRLLQHDEIALESSHPHVAYTVAKRGNQLRVQGAARHWGSKGARLNSISPGVISTAAGRRELQGENGAIALIEMSATRRAGTPSDIAGVVAFLAGPDSSFITGTDILVDGGAVAGRRWNAGI